MRTYKFLHRKMFRKEGDGRDDTYVVSAAVIKVMVGGDSSDDGYTEFVGSCGDFWDIIGVDGCSFICGIIYE